jgi:hypothetical protein
MEHITIGYITHSKRRKCGWILSNLVFKIVQHVFLIFQPCFVRTSKTANIMYSNFRLLWPCIMNVGWRERNQQDATNPMFIIKLLSQHCTVHTARAPAPHNHSHHNRCRTPYAAVHTLVLRMMGIMMPETCWDKSLIINIRLVNRKE